MDLQSIAAIIIFLVVYLGIYSAKIAKEELKQGEKYFFYMQAVIIAIIVFVFVITYNVLLAYFASLISLIAWLLIKNQKKDYFIYPLFGIAIAVTNSFILYTLMLLYSFPTGSLLYHREKKNAWKKALIFVSIVILSLLHYFI